MEVLTQTPTSLIGVVPTLERLSSVEMKQVTLCRFGRSRVRTKGQLTCYQPTTVNT